MKAEGFTWPRLSETRMPTRQYNGPGIAVSNSAAGRESFSGGGRRAGNLNVVAVAIQNDVSSRITNRDIVL